MKKHAPLRDFIKSKLPDRDGATVELICGERAVVEDCGGIVEYENERVRVRTGGRILLLTGDSLTLESYAGGVVVVRGGISSLSYE